MKITPRSAAKASGQTTYFTGKPCKSGHIAERRAKSGSCVECQRKIIAARRAADPEASKIYNREASTKWREANRETHKQRVNDWRSANPQEHRIKSRQYGHNRRSQKRGRIFATDIIAVFKSQRGRCAYCRMLLKPGYHVDHIKSLAKGGTNTKNNIQICCPHCNKRKAARDPIDFARLIGKLI